MAVPESAKPVVMFCGSAHTLAQSRAQYQDAVQTVQGVVQVLKGGHLGNRVELVQGAVQVSGRCTWPRKFLPQCKWDLLDCFCNERFTDGFGEQASLDLGNCMTIRTFRGSWTCRAMSSQIYLRVGSSRASAPIG